LNILIIEDELRAANRLERYIKKIIPTANILAKIPSIRGAISWFDQHSAPDLIFLDVQLEDGESFQILEQRNITSPIIFCTAYSQYALKAFSVNSIDYLLKPIVLTQLERALTKYQRYTGYQMDGPSWPKFPSVLVAEGEQGSGEAGPSQKLWRKQFLVAVAGVFTPVSTENVIAAFSYLKGTQLVDKEGKQWPLDESLVEIERDLDDACFFRISRQCLIRLQAVEWLKRSGSSYQLKLYGVTETLTVSRAHVSSLKQRLLSL